MHTVFFKWTKMGLGGLGMLLLSNPKGVGSAAADVQSAEGWSADIPYVQHSISAIKSPRLMKTI